MRNWFEALRGIFLGALPPKDSDESPTVDSILSSDEATRTSGFIVIGVLVFGFGGWAFFAPLESAVIGEGTVQVEGRRKPIQHLEGGIVSSLKVKNGDYVAEGQPILQLDTTRHAAEKKTVEGRLWAKEASVSRLLSERDGQNDVMFLGSVADEVDSRAQVAMDSERALFAARKADRLGEISVVEQKIAQLEEQIRGAQALLEAKNRISESLRMEVADLQTLLADGYIDKQRLLQLERSAAQTIGEIAEIKANIARLRVSVEEGRLSVIQIQKRFVTEVVSELTRAQDELYGLEQQYDVIADALERATVRSPASGYVLALQPKSTGAVIGSGQEIAAVVPDVDKLIINAKISPMDIDRISIGQKAEVKFSVFKDAYTVTGILSSLSADSLTDEVTGQAYFETTIDLNNDDLRLLGPYKLVPGLPAQVLIKTGNRTLIGYLTSPMQRMFERSLVED